MLEAELAAPEFLDFSALNVSNKSKLCAAMRIIDQRTNNICIKINRLRNNLAHKLNSEITDSTFKDIIDEYHPQFRESFLTHAQEELKNFGQKETPTIMAAKLVRDFVGILQGIRRCHEIGLQKKAAAYDVARRVLRNCNCGAPSKAN